MTGTDGWARTPRRALPRRLPMSARTCCVFRSITGIRDPAAFPVEGPVRRAVGGVEKAPVQVHEVWAQGKAGVGVATWSRYPIVGSGGHRLRHPEQQRLCRDRHRVERRHGEGLQRAFCQFALRVGGICRARGRRAGCRRPATDLVADAGGLFRAGDPGQTGDGRSGPQSPPGGPAWDFNDVPVSWALQAARGQLRDAHDVRGGRMDGTWQGAGARRAHRPRVRGSGRGLSWTMGLGAMA